MSQQLWTHLPPPELTVYRSGQACGDTYLLSTGQQVKTWHGRNPIVDQDLICLAGKLSPLILKLLSKCIMYQCTVHS